MDALLETLESILVTGSRVAVVFLELLGGIVVLVGAVAVLRLLLRPHHPNPVTIRLALAQSLKLALEFYLAAEILKTVALRNLEDLSITGLIVGLRIIMTILIHWEERHDRDELAAEQTPKPLGQ